MQSSTYFTDEVYLDSSRHLQRLNNSIPLKIHESLFSFISSYLTQTNLSHASVLDVGCGFGEFLMHLGRQPFASKLNLSGLEKSQKLAEFTESHLQNVNIYSQDLLSFSKSSQEKYDIVCISGVHPTIDDLPNFLSPLEGIVSENSLILINGPFHTRDLSLFVQWSYDDQSSMMNKGWNVYSVGNISKLMHAMDFKLKDNHVIEIPSIDEDLRSLAQFNITSDSGLKYYLNGLGLRFSVNTLAFYRSV